jgi:hypothetical protein
LVFVLLETCEKGERDIFKQRQKRGVGVARQNELFRMPENAFHLRLPFSLAGFREQAIDRGKQGCQIYLAKHYPNRQKMYQMSTKCAKWS